jgi:hypothetical protein
MPISPNSINENKTTPITMKNRDTKWFTHDMFATQDPKITLLMATYSFAGYGRWWHMLEILRAEEEYKYNIAGKYAYTILADRLRMTVAKTKTFIADCISYDLFQTDGESLWCNYLVDRMEYLEKRKAVLSERGKKGAAIKHAKLLAQAENTDDTITVLLDNEDGTSTIVLCKEQAHYTTLQNTILQNTTASTTKQETKTEAAADPLSNQTKTIWESHKTAALADKMKFVYPMVSSGRVTEQQLERWLSAFNRTLDFRGDPPKSYNDYRSHFNQWFKYRNTAVEDPDAITGVAAPVHTPSPAVTNAMGYCKTPEQAQADLDRHHEEWKKQRAKEKENQKRA